MEKNEGLPPQKIHEAVRKTVEEATGNVATKVNLRKMLEMSLNKRAYVEDMASDFVEGFNKYNTSEQSSIIQYVLLADLLKRKLWSEINQNIKNTVDSTEMKSLEDKNLNWKDTIDEMLEVIFNQAIQFFSNWAFDMRTKEKDEMYSQRFGELEDAIETQEKYLPTPVPRSPEILFIQGYSTGVAFPMGMLKHMPDLLREKGIEPTKEKIVEYFLKNLVSTSSAYAAQDLTSFAMIDSTLHPSRTVSFSGDKNKATNFSPEFFTLNEQGKIVMKEGAFERIHQAVKGFIPTSFSKVQVEINKSLNAKEKKPQLPDGKAEYTWKTCPALFANLINDYDSFFKPILNKVLEIEKEY